MKKTLVVTNQQFLTLSCYAEHWW